MPRDNRCRFVRNWAQVIWDIETETQYLFPWARKHFILKTEAGSTQVLLRSNGQVVARSKTAESVESKEAEKTNQEATEAPAEGGNKPLSCVVRVGWMSDCGLLFLMGMVSSSVDQACSWRRGNVF
jgi:hypothetical protein